MLSVSKRELLLDFRDGGESMRSQIFRKIYDNELANIEGEPFASLIGDYEFTNSVDDVDLLSQMSQVAAIASVPHCRCRS